MSRKQKVKELVELSNSIDQDAIGEQVDALVNELIDMPNEAQIVEDATQALIAGEMQAIIVEKKARYGVGKFVMNLIKTQPTLTNQQLLEEVYKEFGDKVKTTKACIAWYKTASKKI